MIRVINKSTTRFISNSVSNSVVAGIRKNHINQRCYGSMISSCMGSTTYSTSAYTKSSFISDTKFNNLNTLCNTTSLIRSTIIKNNNNRLYSTSNSNSNNNSKDYYQEKKRKNYNQQQFKSTHRVMMMSAGGLGLVTLVTSGFGGNNNNGEEPSINSFFSGFKVKDSWLVLGSIVAINGVIFLLVQNPAFLQRFGAHFFCSISNIGTHPLSILLSNFTHLQPMHFLFNMVGLWSFGSVAYEHMGTIPFLALYLGGGLVGSMTSVVHKLITSNLVTPSIGASGCVLAVVGASIMFEPNNRVSIILLPFFSFESQTMLYAMMAFDLAGVIALGKYTGWDHACHLGSVIAGVSIGESYRYKTKFQNFQGNGKSYLRGVWTYQGEFANGNFNGYGTLHEVPTNNLYKGQFVNGLFMKGTMAKDGKTFEVHRKIKD